MKRSALHSVHDALGAKFIDFNGWELPLSYEVGTLSEHSACRNGVAVFDVSHLGRMYLTNAEKYLQWRLVNDLTKLKPMQARYTHILDAEDGSVLDDLICICLKKDDKEEDKEKDKYLLLVNAGNYDMVLKEFSDIEITEDNENSVLLAIQGPKVDSCLNQVLGVSSISKNTASWVSFKGEEILMLGTGYTGEVGVECVVPNSIAEDFIVSSN